MQTQNKQTATAKQTQKATAKATTTNNTLLDGVIAKINKAIAKDNNISMTQVTGYLSVKYGNKVLFELHAKKKAIAHLTFAHTQKVFALLKEQKLIHRIVDASYMWKYDTECLLTENFAKQFDAILKSVIEQAIEERNLKQKATQKQEQKTA